MSEQLTDWFPAHVKPARPGVYETDEVNTGERCYQFWNGEFWGYASSTPAEAAEASHLKSMFQDDKWRGLSVKPSPITDEQTDDTCGVFSGAES